MYSPLFISGLARSGTNLLSRMIVAGNNASIAIHGFQPVFKAFRNSLVMQKGAVNIRANFDPASPFGDGYFTREKRETLDLVLNADLSLQVDPNDRQPLQALIEARCSDDATDLLPLLYKLNLTRDYGATIQSIIDIVAEARGNSAHKWVGAVDTWHIDSFPALARQYSNARFIVIMRDPRANTASNQKGAEEHTRANALSYLRQWRKYTALCRQFEKGPFSQRFKWVRYEDLLLLPEETCRTVCDFLTIPFDPVMLDSSNYFDHGTGRLWRGNSSFKTVKKGFDTARIEHWRTFLDSPTIALADFVCGPDMVDLGYVPEMDCITDDQPTSILEHLTKINDDAFWWRSDFADPQLDFGFEMVRRELLRLPEASDDVSLIRRNFLFEDTYAALRSYVENNLLSPNQ